MKVGAGYAAMLAAGVLCFLFVSSSGARLVAPAPASSAAPMIQSPSAHGLLNVLFTLAIVVVAARILGRIFRHFRQPPVIGEVLAGIVLGPSLLGRLAPEASQFVLPPSAAPLVGTIAQLGVILYMFLVGLEFDTRVFRRQTHTSIAVSHASILLPFTLGAALALWLYPRFSTSDVPFVVFALFIGVSMSVTAFPVLTRIIGDLGLQHTRLGGMAVACAAVDDVTAWCLLAFVVAMVRAEPGGALVTLALTLGYVGVMLLAVRPLVARLARRAESVALGQDGFAGLCVGVLLSALATELIGIHALFGAFLLGAIIPHDSRLAAALQSRLGDLVVVLFLPAFFAFTGLRTQISLVQSSSDWLWCGVVILIASAGKLGGSAAAARLSGLPWRESLSLGALMNTRGLMELIILNVALDLGVISPKLFAILVIMALVTTLATAPLLQWLYRAPAAQPLAQPGLARG